jgi:hypothetical protein
MTAYDGRTTRFGLQVCEKLKIFKIIGFFPYYAVLRRITAFLWVLSIRITPYYGCITGGLV